MAHKQPRKGEMNQPTNNVGHFAAKTKDVPAKDTITVEADGYADLDIPIADLQVFDYIYDEHAGEFWKVIAISRKEHETVVEVHTGEGDGTNETDFLRWKNYGHASVRRPTTPELAWDASDGYIDGPAPLTKRERKEQARLSRPFKDTRQHVDVIDGLECAVVDGSYGPHYVRMDVINDETVEAYRTGQCMAFAIEAHRRTGWPIVIREMNVLDGDMGENLPLHFFVRSPDGRLLDIGGYNDEDMVTEEFEPGESLREWGNADMVHNLYAHQLLEQDYATAHHLVPAALERADALDRGDADPFDDWPIGS